MKTTLLSALTMMVFLTGCTEEEFGVLDKVAVNVTDTPYEFPLDPVDEDDIDNDIPIDNKDDGGDDDVVDVCDPMDQRPIEQSKGLRAKLGVAINSSQIRHLNDLQGENIHWFNEIDYIFSNVSVPGRRFEVGFPGPDGNPLVHPDSETNEPVLEEFSLVYESRLKLTLEQQGYYQFAMLSDDGVSLKIGGVEYVANPAHHATQFDGTVIVNKNDPQPTSKIKVAKLTADTFYDFSLQYFQGPRYHIANTVYWRKLPVDDDVLSTTHFDEHLTNKYFGQHWGGDLSNVPYDGFLAEGWEVIPSEVFYQPEGNTHTCDL